MTSTPRRLRCAIYTRKSTEEGLEQAFNSLDAACAAYILSQRHEGWQLVPELYDDGGFTGGNMERPGLQRLMADVQAGKVHVVVVYKVDRLTRSLRASTVSTGSIGKKVSAFASVGHDAGRSAHGLRSSWRPGPMPAGAWTSSMISSPAAGGSACSTSSTT